VSTGWFINLSKEKHEYSHLNDEELVLIVVFMGLRRSSKNEGPGTGLAPFCPSARRLRGFWRHLLNGSGNHEFVYFL